MYSNDEEALGLNYFAAAFAACALVSWCSELEQDKRVDLLNESAAVGCERAYQRHNDIILKNDCAESFSFISQNAEDQDIIGLKELSGSDLALMRQNFQDEAYNQSLIENVEKRNFISAETKIKTAIKSIEVNGARIYSNSNVAVNFESIVSYHVVGQGDVVSGKWNVAIGDPNSNASRNFLYDYATGKATGPSGSSSGTTDFWFRYRPYGGTAETASTNVNDLQDCSKSNAEISCIIADAVHGVLNGNDGSEAMSAAELQTYRSSIMAQYESPSEDRTYRTRLTGFSVGKVERDGRNFSFN